MKVSFGLRVALAIPGESFLELPLQRRVLGLQCHVGPEPDVTSQEKQVDADCLITLRGNLSLFVVVRPEEALSPSIIWGGPSPSRLPNTTASRGSRRSRGAGRGPTASACAAGPPR